jgi:PAS domain S-box-containing protein
MADLLDWQWGSVEMWPDADSHEAMNNHRLQEEVRLRGSLLEALHEIATTANAADHIEQFLQTAIERLQSELRAVLAHAVVLSLPPSQPTETLHYWKFPSARSAHALRSKIEAGEDRHGRYPTLSRGRSGWIENPIRSLPPEMREAVRHLGLRAGLACPIRIAGAVKGWLEFYWAEPVEAASEVSKALTCVAMDLGHLIARVEARHREHESYDIVESIVAVGPLLVFCVDLERGRLRFASHSFATFMGWEEKPTQEKPMAAILEHIHPDDRHRVAGLTARLLEVRTDEIVEGEFRARRRDDEYRWIRSWARGFGHGADGHPGLVLVSAMDITERRRLERKLANLEIEAHRSVGQEIHDGLCQELVGASLMCDALERGLASSSPENADQVRHLRGILQQALERSRIIMKGLLPVEMEDEGLTSALRQLAERIDVNFSGICRFRSRGRVLLNDASRATQLYWIAHEAASNAAQHSGADNVDIELEARDGRIFLTISDDGEGLPLLPAQESGTGMGMRIMRHRADLLDASLEFTSHERGTRVICSLSE